MITMIFDTETTGKANHKVPDPTVQPYPVQLACALIHNDKVVNLASVIVNPGVPIEEEASGVHGIDDETAKTFGLSLQAASGLFLNFLNKADRIVAHNVDFDIIVAEAMIYRVNADFNMDKFREKPRVCTMISATDICKIPGKYGYKWPKLEEAYKILVDPEGIRGAHDALVDVMACWKILKALENLSIPLQRGKR